MWSNAVCQLHISEADLTLDLAPGAASLCQFFFY